MVDLVRLPVEQYRKDGRLMRGFQRGASSFGTSTAMAAVELTNRMVRLLQVSGPLQAELGGQLKVQGEGGGSSWAVNEELGKSKVVGAMQ